MLVILAAKSGKIMKPTNPARTVNKKRIRSGFKTPTEGISSEYITAKVAAKIAKTKRKISFKDTKIIPFSKVG